MAPYSLTAVAVRGCIAEFGASWFGSEFAKASRLLRKLDRIEKLAGGTHRFGGRHD